MDPNTLNNEFQEFTPSAGISFAELAGLDNDEFLKKIKAYQPPERMFKVEAMGELVENVIKSDITRYIKISQEIADIRPQFANLC